MMTMINPPIILFSLLPRVPPLLPSTTDKVPHHLSRLQIPNFHHSLFLHFSPSPSLPPSPFSAMDPNPNRFPILSYILSHLHPAAPKSPQHDVENPNPSSSQSEIQLLNRMPKIHHPDILSSMIQAVSDVSQTRSVLRSLGPRPDHETIDAARSQIAEIDAALVGRRDEVEAGAQKLPYVAVIKLDEMHGAYEELLREAEERLERMYVSSCGSGGVEVREEEEEGWNENVVGILREAAVKCVDRVELSGQGIRFLPEDFGRVRGLVCLNVSNNQLEVCGF